VKNSPGMNEAQANKQADRQPPKLQVMPDALLQPLLNSLSIMSLELRASLITAQGNRAGAKKLFLSAAQQEKALGYREPPTYIRPVGETEAVAMIAVHDWKAAKDAYKEALLERPRSGFALYGIAISSENAGDAGAATKGYSDFLAAWKDADHALPQMTHARAYLAGHTAVAGRQR
jgi:hypothetical protein